MGDSRRAGHHQPDWETNESLHGETNELGTAGEPDTTSQIGRQMNRYMGRQNWRQAKSGHHQPDWETNESLYGETNELETAGHHQPD